MTLEAARRRAEGAGPKRRTLRMIGNAHIDPVWLWRWPEGLQEVWATFRSALDRLSEYPEAVFTASSAAFYEWIERTDPEMFEEIRTRVAEGRWAVVGGWWVEADSNLPSGESFVRQALYGQRFFARAFGRIATVACNPDAFGHAGTLPQLLRKSGLESFVFMRPQPHEADLPGPLFWWRGPDGSRVLAARLVHEYCSPGDDLERYVEALLAKADGHEWNELLCFYGVGNHGGGPTKANLDGIRRLDASPAMPALRHAAPDTHFDALRRDGAASLPVHDGELQHHARGCYAAHSAIKRLNRSTEQLLMTAEKASALASAVTGAPLPGDFETAWRSLLFNQFHDILAGTSIESAYDDARDQIGEARSIAGRNLHAGLAAIGRRIDIPLEPDARPIVVHNLHAWPVRAPVELEMGRIRPGSVLVDEADRVVPFQLTQSEATVNGSRARPTFLADVPPMGHRVYRLLGGRSAAETLPGEAAPLPAGDTWAETERLRIDVDPVTGTFRLRDLGDGTELLCGGGRAVVLRDPGDTWAHGVERFDEVIGEFTARSVRLVERGPVRTVIRIESAFGASRLVQDACLYRGVERVRVTVTLDWQERRGVLKLRFPTPLLGPVATYETPYGFVERDRDGAEEPGQAWLDLTGWLPGPAYSGSAADPHAARDRGPVRDRDVLRRDSASPPDVASAPDVAPRPDSAPIRGGRGEVYGLSLLNDAKYSYDVAGADMGMTIARSPIYAHHDPAVPDPAAEYSYLDVGRQRFTYELLPHRGSWREGRTVRATAELLSPPIALPETFHAGPLGQRESFIAVDHPAVVVSVVKPAEDGAALVVRAVETFGCPAEATIAIIALGREIRATFGPHEIRTWLVPLDHDAPIVETDLLERPSA